MTINKRNFSTISNGELVRQLYELAVDPSMDPRLACRIEDIIEEIGATKEVVTRNDRRMGRRKPLIAMHTEEVAAMFAVPYPIDHIHVGPMYKLGYCRLRAAMALLDRTGIRSSELLDLVESDLNPTDGTILIRYGKGNKRRTVGMDLWGWCEVLDWLAIRNDEVKSGYLLPVLLGPTAGNKWASADLRRQLRRRAELAGLSHTANPHSWRHGFSVRYWKATNDLLGLKTQLGHADLTTTEIYLENIYPLERLKKVIDFAPPMVEIPHLLNKIGRSH